MQERIRNIAIIAHVDHGKTTLVDAMLKHAGVFRENEAITERVMDSNDLEKERGITILAKNLSVHHGRYKINIVDTPGHADFGGEVERVLKMVDSVLLLVDALDGPMPQTRFVLKKSLDLGLKPIVVINKIDRPGSRPDEVVDMVFDLFCELNATDEQLDFPIVYTSAKLGFAKLDLNSDSNSMEPLFAVIESNVHPPAGDSKAPFQLLVTNIDYNDYIGRIATGRIFNGRVKAGETVALVRRDGSIERGRITKLLGYEGLKQVEIPEACTGDIVTVAGFDDVGIGETLAAADNPVALPYVSIDEPTISMNFIVNSSPFAGREGKFVTSRNIRERLDRELRTNVSLRVEDTANADTFKVSGRGELHLSILIENMRREGFEMAVSKPEVILRVIDGTKMEPMEYLVVDVPSEFQGAIIEKMGPRKGEMTSLQPMGETVRLEFVVPARGLIGLRGELLTETRGTAVMTHTFHDYAPYKGDIPGRKNGVLIAMELGETTAYALDALQPRGILFIGPGVEVYGGMIIGQHAKDNDLDVNPCKGKKLTNVRASGSDDAIKLTPPRILTLEQALEFIDDDELVEVTPQSIRLRKKELDPNKRKRK
ncbi:translational GTPase TypA [Geobacter sulfurreducens]|uniref:Large ribosomal subunit assembly factor BipA n=1 Tax=Geobacter sulfurreducens (strain ATCC 51573 / DSM 12127 / PCA) TaxID=243231 RepID=Q74FV3_GEOSL|nr:translational GTPase TypA [Geobacter sulfurreducens]AAR33831.1 translation-regulating membrane GTPase TypA [Geobacter sulfurreducens PCA]ADI83352.1 translation-regulating membrane GTPase TypA [Geobacter sulfurreducens KN400]AJY70253.1 GTP-binding protein TypA [Geobacter sulfurreducens]QVW35756.1 translational GTPase TypA [Geobacter sulfurreducens]UAC04578.1 translational GTPase TypA [Geobacter sulfurreducens]